MTDILDCLNTPSPRVERSWARFMVRVTEVHGDLLDQSVEAIVNAWNRNIFPWWLLLPQGVSGAIKRRAGTAPFRELSRIGLIPLGEAVATGAGKLPYRAIIHVAGINLLWRASEKSVRSSTANAVKLAIVRGLRSLAFPVIGAGSGGFDQKSAKALMLDELSRAEGDLDVVVVEYSKRRS